MSAPLHLDALLPRSVPLTSLNGAARRLMDERPELNLNKVQAQYLADAGIYGTAYGDDVHRSFARDQVESVLHRPLRHLADFADEAALRPHPMVLVLRLRPAIVVDERYDEDDPHARSFTGIHAAIERSDDPSVRIAADNAIREWWGIPPARRKRIRQTIASNGFVPLLLSIGKYVIGARDIIGVEEPAGDTTRVALDVCSASDWSAPFIDSWLDSGRGQPTIWWDRSLDQ